MCPQQCFSALLALRAGQDDQRRPHLSRRRQLRPSSSSPSRAPRSSPAGPPPSRARRSSDDCRCGGVSNAAGAGGLLLPSPLLATASLLPPAGSSSQEASGAKPGAACCRGRPQCSSQRSNSSAAPDCAAAGRRRFQQRGCLLVRFACPAAGGHPRSRCASLPCSRPQVHVPAHLPLPHHSATCNVHHAATTRREAGGHWRLMQSWPLWSAEKPLKSACWPWLAERTARCTLGTPVDGVLLQRELKAQVLKVALHVCKAPIEDCRQVRNAAAGRTPRFGMQASRWRCAAQTVRATNRSVALSLPGTPQCVNMRDSCRGAHLCARPCQAAAGRQREGTFARMAADGAPWNVRPAG